MDQALKKRIEKLVKEKVSLAPYNPDWPEMFKKEKRNLEQILPKKIIKRIEHFGSTAIPGICAKPIIDILIEVSSLEKTKKIIVPILEKRGYDYFWRPTIGNQPPYYAWFIKRNSQGQRTHHLHLVEKDSRLWERLYFKDYLIKFPKKAKEYDELKKRLSTQYPSDRIKYTEKKGSFIVATTRKAKKYYTT